MLIILEECSIHYAIPVVRPYTCILLHIVGIKREGCIVAKLHDVGLHKKAVVTYKWIAFRGYAIDVISCTCILFTFFGVCVITTSEQRRRDFIPCDIYLQSMYAVT